MDFFPVYFGVAEGMRELRKADFVLVKDANFKFKYYKVSNKLAKFAMSYILISEWGLECDWLCLGWVMSCLGWGLGWCMSCLGWALAWDRSGMGPGAGHESCLG